MSYSEYLKTKIYENKMQENIYADMNDMEEFVSKTIPNRTTDITASLLQQWKINLDTMERNANSILQLVKIGRRELARKRVNK
jgi:hypothetical protein